MTKRVGRVLAIVLVCLILLALYMLSGTSASEARVEYTVDAHDAAGSVLHVTMLIHPSIRPFVTLWLRDTNQAGLQRVEGFSASRGGRLLPDWQTLPGLSDVRNVWTGFSREPIEIRYDVDPRWLKGRSYRAFLGPDLGYFKGEVFLYTPISLKGIPGMLNIGGSPKAGEGQARLQFFLPVGWTLISPWGSGELEMPIADMRGAYFGAGTMSVKTAQAGDSTLLLGVYTRLSETEKDRFLQDVPDLFETAGEITGLSPGCQAPYWTLTVLSHELIEGGSSGRNSLVTYNNISVISHEMFHWWNGDIVATTPEADWIHEGFTKYYEGKILYSAGIWSLDEFQEHLEQLYEHIELGADGHPVPINLVLASENLVRQGANEEYYNVYHGGALVAYFLDQELQAQGKSLDEIWELLDDVTESVTTEVFLHELEKLGGAELAGECEDLVYGRHAIP